MNSFGEVFSGEKYVFLPVIHVINEGLAEHNIRIARNNGADGCFIISHNSHDVSFKELLACYTQIKRKHPKFWLGINFLDLDLLEVPNLLSNEIDGLWSDEAIIQERSANPSEQAKKFMELLSKKDWEGLYFGALDFKYQAPVSNLEQRTIESIPFADVLTTSGIGTGYAAELNKIRTIRENAGDKPIAIASGITPQNVDNYKQYIDCYMVATGISRDFYNLDPEKVRDLASKLGK